MISIVIFHCKGGFDNLILEVIKRVGFCGVDIFIFLSGIGCFFSMENNQISKFYKKRFMRIYPSYLLVVLIFNVINNNFILNYELLGDFFMVSYVFNLSKPFDWYIPSILILYILTPIISKNRIKCIFLSIIVYFLCIFFKCNYLLIFITRIPIYIFGNFIGEQINLKKQISKKDYIQMILGFILGLNLLVIFILKYKEFLRKYGLWWIPFILITFPLCYFLSFILEKLKKKKIKYLQKIIYFFGEYSLEIYLIHERILKILNGKNLSISTLNIVALFLTLLLAIYLKKIINRVFFNYNKKLKKKGLV